MALSKHKREVYRRKIESFWLDFSHNKIGFFGLIIVIGIVIIAITAPLLTPYTPRTLLEQKERLATTYAVPAWFTIFPQFSDYCPTVKITPDLNGITIINQSGPIETNLDKLNINLTLTESSSREASITLDLGKFNYPYSSPPSFQIRVNYTLFYNRTGTGLKTYFIIKNYTTYPTWEYFINPNEVEIKIGTFYPPPQKYMTSNKTENELELNSVHASSQIFNFSRIEAAPADPASLIFPEKGIYGIQVKFEFFNTTTKGTNAQLYLREVHLDIWGNAHGILGTNFLGGDVWTELVYGARISLIVGILAALAATTLGITYGVISGYLGGFVDEFLMRIVDVLLCIPILPILLVLMRYFKPNVYYIVVLIAIFGWQGLSRVIRSRVLSLKEMAFIESAKASGASDSYLIVRHLIPNVLPIAMSAMVLAVPGAIITEASLTFLGFGDLNTPTWGRILYYAYQQHGLEKWWVWVPPGLAICLLCLGFVFMGHAIDEIVNPRLRRRR